MSKSAQINTDWLACLQIMQNRGGFLVNMGSDGFILHENWQVHLAKSK